MRVTLKLFTTARPSWLKWLIKMELLKYVRLNLTERKRGALDQYFSTQLKIDPWTTSQIILFAFNHLKFQVNKETQIIKIDDEVVLPGTSYRLKDLVRLINYGNLEVGGNSIFTEAFSYLENNMNKILLRGMM